VSYGLDDIHKKIRFCKTTYGDTGNNPGQWSYTWIALLLQAKENPAKGDAGFSACYRP